MDKQIPHISDYAIELIFNHPFFGNIRELKTYIFDGVVLSEMGTINDEVLLCTLQGAVVHSGIQSSHSNPLVSIFDHFPTLKELIIYAVEIALDDSNYNQSQAAHLLGISRQALHKRLKK